MEVHALPKQEAGTVAKTLAGQYISPFGAPAHLHSDQGNQFESHLIKKLLGEVKMKTTPFHSQSDGQSERNIKMLTHIIAIVTQQQEE